MAQEEDASVIEASAPAGQDAGIDPGSSASDTVEPSASYTGSLVVLDPIEKTLVNLENRHKNVVFDLTTTKGNKAARDARQELVKTRTGAKKAFDTWNAPIKAEQAKGKDRVAEIERRVRALEEPIDQQIKADEARREVERQERERIEAERVATIRARITNISNVPTLAVDMNSAEIQAVIDDIMAMELTEERFAEFLAEAEDTAARVHEKLKQMLESVTRREQDAERLRQQQEELDRQRAELAKQAEELARQKVQQAEEAEKARILEEERQRAAADKAARDAEDAKRAAAGQADAFAHEKAEAVQVVRDATRLRQPLVITCANRRPYPPRLPSVRKLQPPRRGRLTTMSTPQQHWRPSMTSSASTWSRSMARPALRQLTIVTPTSGCPAQSSLSKLYPRPLANPTSL